MDLLADSALVGFNTSSTSAIQSGVWNPIFGWSILRRDFLNAKLRWVGRNDVSNWGGYWPWRVGWNRRSSRVAVSMHQCVMPILASETVVSACAIPELMAAWKAIGAQLLPLSIGYRHLLEAWTYTHRVVLLWTQIAAFIPVRSPHARNACATRRQLCHTFVFRRHAG